MNDSEAAVEFLKGLNVPLRSAVSLDVQTIEAWRESHKGLNPVQAGMQVAIPEIDGATEPFVYGGIPAEGGGPAAPKERSGPGGGGPRPRKRAQTEERRGIEIGKAQN